MWPRLLPALDEERCGGSPFPGVRAKATRSTPYLVDRDDWEAVGRVHGSIFGDVRPVSTMVVVSGFIDPRRKVEFEADSIVPE